MEPSSAAAVFPASEAVCSVASVLLECGSAVRATQQLEQLASS